MPRPITMSVRTAGQLADFSLVVCSTRVDTSDVEVDARFAAALGTQKRGRSFRPPGEAALVRLQDEIATTGELANGLTLIEEAHQHPEARAAIARAVARGALDHMVESMYDRLPRALAALGLFEHVEAVGWAEALHLISKVVHDRDEFEYRYTLRCGLSHTPPAPLRLRSYRAGSWAAAVYPRCQGCVEVAGDAGEAVDRELAKIVDRVAELATERLASIVLRGAIDDEIHDAALEIWEKVEAEPIADLICDRTGEVAACVFGLVDETDVERVREVAADLAAEALELATTSSGELLAELRSYHLPELWGIPTG